MNTTAAIPELAEFLAAQEHWSARTRERCSAWVKALLHFLSGHQVDWRQAGSHHLKLFESHLQWNSGSRGMYAANSIFQALHLVRKFYRWALLRQYIQTDPMAGWILPRPRLVSERLLTQLELLQLFNLPDLTRPSGQRDSLMLALIYHRQFSLQRCLNLRYGELTWSSEHDASVRAAYERYVQQSRGTVPGQLFLSPRGQPITTLEPLRQRLKKLGQKMGFPELSARILHKSWKAHQDGLSRRQGSFK